MNTKPALRIEGTIPPDLSVKNLDRFLFISFDQGKMTHGLHKYPAKFFPELPRWLISRYSNQGETVLDPFMGSGTVNIEASLLDRPSIGVDVDLFARFIAQTKTTPLPIKALQRAHRTIRDGALAYKRRIGTNDVPIFPYRDHWFQKNILHELAYLKQSIEDLPASQAIKNFFLVCFSSIIRAVSEADNNCTRTVIRKKLNKVVSQGDAISRFLRVIDKQVPHMVDFASAEHHAPVNISSVMDARDLHEIEDDSIPLAVTSPPYLNAVDYPRTHQLEMYWLGIVTGSLQGIKRQHVGTEAVLSQDYKHLHSVGHPLADRVIRELYRVDPRRSYIAAKYLRDMKTNLSEVYRVLRPGGRYVVVIGSNLVRGFPFENWRYLKEMAPHVGYTLDLVCVSSIIRHFIKVPRKEQIMDDYILVMGK